jgi:hypothetical protein
MKPLLIIVPILLIGGTLGAGFMGVVNIPGVTPKKGAAKDKPASEEAAQAEPEAETGQTETTESSDETALEAPVEEPSLPEPRTEPQSDPALGAKALAKYWDEIDTNKLVPITDTYSERELAAVLVHMKKDKVAQLLATVGPDRAAKLSRELQRLASVVMPEAP